MSRCCARTVPAWNTKDPGWTLPPSRHPSLSEMTSHSPDQRARTVQEERGEQTDKAGLEHRQRRELVRKGNLFKVLDSEQQMKLIIERISDLFRLYIPPPPPQYVVLPQLQSTCHYMLNHYVKIWHVLLGGANNMHPLRWGGGGGAKMENIPNFCNRKIFRHCVNLSK